MELDDQQMLLVDDDEVFCEVLVRALNHRGLKVSSCSSNNEALTLATDTAPDLALIDLRIGDQSGLDLIPKLVKLNPAMKIVVLTGYASIATAIEAIKLGALHYLTKPTDVEEIINAFCHQNKEVEINSNPMSLDRLEWEHIQKVITECEGNISLAARQLGMHRRTLQRKLQKRPSNLN